MIPIPFTDQCLLATYTEMDPITGDSGVGAPEPTPCRINYQAKMITNFKGEMVLTVAKIYMPGDILITPKDIITIRGNNFPLKSLEEKKDFVGNINHYVVYI